MYRIISGSTHGLRDTKEFVELLGEQVVTLPGSWRDLFDGQCQVIVTRAPGRIDLMGGIADYSGSLVLPLPIADATHVAFQRAPNKKIRIASLPSTSKSEPRLFEIALAELLADGLPLGYAEAHAKLTHNSESNWAAYIVGAFLVLMREGRLDLHEGANVLIRSSVPEGKGVSSSAALEVAVMHAIVAAFELEITAPETALLCQRLENHIAGAPCGVMDQMTAACGEAHHLLALLCQPAELKDLVRLPAELEVWGIDSGVSHSIGGADYGTVRTAAFMGYRIIADCAGLNVRVAGPSGRVEIEDRRWNGYLANVSPEEFEQKFADEVPNRILGKDFLDHYQGITDTFTEVDPQIDYPVRRATEHPIYEHRRVQAFAHELKNWRGVAQAGMLGDWMSQSHQSYSACGLGSAATDKLATLATEASGKGLIGARISGGGSGGTVAILGRRGAGAAVEEIADRYRRETGRQATIISGSSCGAETFGALKLQRTDNFA